MLPDSAVRDITIYPRHIQDGEIRLIRRVLKRCSWRKKNINTDVRSGQIVKETVIIRVLDAASGLKWLSPYEWSKRDFAELEGFWTCDIYIEPATMLVPFASEHEFGVFASTGDAARAEHEFLFLPENTGTVRAFECNDNSSFGKAGAHIRIHAG